MHEQYEPTILEMRKKLNMMKEDRHQYKREAFIEVYEEYVQTLEQYIEALVKR
ncbi:hypothetical protein [Bacillus sp. FJAT-45037]|uniref:hypothetical protein n=1 Tax=Bacillus sp. FJAT-45037 TaxID=2011007 RepID=UPI0012FD19F4|nr:hypothetical protein [Bacillus sp. FJAT-45037]